MNVTQWIQKHAPAILTAIGSLGVAATCVLAVQAAPKAKARSEQAQREKGEALTVSETALAQAPAYIPAGLCGVGTLACIWGAHALSRRQQAMLTSAYAALSSAFGKYKEQVRCLCGEATDDTVQKRLEEQKKDQADGNPPWDIPQTFYLDGYGEFFERTMEEVVRAEYSLNRIFVLSGTATFNDLLHLLSLPKTDGGERLGWDAYVGEALYGYSWIDFTHRHYLTTDGMLVCAIEMPFPPHPYEKEYDEMADGLENWRKSLDPV